jgi:Zn finger protein HypA/HybF involved in hydrogenase expression
MIAFTTSLGNFILFVLEMFGSVVAVIVAFIILLYVVVWGTAFICAALDWRKKRRVHGRKCPHCGQYQVYGQQGERVCTNCGAHEVHVSNL